MLYVGEILVFLWKMLDFDMWIFEGSSIFLNDINYESGPGYIFAENLIWSYLT